jgi:hypothetical protein
MKYARPRNCFHTFRRVDAWYNNARRSASLSGDLSFPALASHRARAGCESSGPVMVFDGVYACTDNIGSVSGFRGELQCIRGLYT